MAELTLEHTSVYDLPDGRYAGFLSPSGGEVLVPTSTGFSFLDKRGGSAPEAQEATVERLPFELDPEIRDSIITCVVEEDRVPLELALTHFQNMQIFLRAIDANRFRGIILTPCKGVDKMWHELMKRPRAYFAACDAAGGLIDHVPITPNGAGAEEALNLPETFQFLVDEGYNPNPAAWPLDSAGDCAGTSCTNGDCTAGGPPKTTAQVLRLSGVELL